MRWLVQQHFPQSAIGEAQSFQKILADLPKRAYDLVVLDAEIGGAIQVLSTAERIKRVSPKTRILVFSDLDELIYGPKYLAFGINGYIGKKAELSSIVLAIKTVLGGGIFRGSTPCG